MTTSADLPHRDAGFTLVELLVGITVSLIVLLATLTSLDAFSSNAAHQTRVTDANGQVRQVMDSTVTDLRGASLLLKAQPTDLAYAVPVSSAATRVERLCIASNELYGSSTADDATPVAPTAACATGTKIATLKSTSATGFTYDGASSAATPGTVKNVGLIFGLTIDQAGKTATSTLRASAARRAAGQLPISGEDLNGQCNAAGALLSLSASVGEFGPVTVTYANDGGVAIGTPVTGGVQIPEGITRVVATITDALGATNTIQKDIECS
jgi:prepilin-type N-terminal cleavage/methylation domain-containing protein